MTTRDSKAWLPIAVAGVLSSLALQPELVEHLLELDKKAIAAVICLGLGIVAAWMRASPINDISDEGREKYEEAARLKR